MRYYATYTTTRRNQQAMANAGIGTLLGPDQLDYYPPNLCAWGIGPYALDNGAWGAFKNGGAFDADGFWRVLERWGDAFDRRAASRGAWCGSAQRPDFIVCPDIVAGALDSLDLSLRWLPYVRQYGPPLIAVQDGMRPEHVEEYIGPGCGIFVGGSTGWKWSTLAIWAAVARLYRCHLHVGRVNSARGIRVCRAHGVTSADGTSASRFAVNAPKLGAACVGPSQMALQVALMGSES